MRECHISARGLRNDREFMMVTDSGVCVSQKRVPQLCIVEPSISLSQQRLMLSHPSQYIHTTFAATFDVLL